MCSVYSCIRCFWAVFVSILNENAFRLELCPYCKKVAKIDVYVVLEGGAVFGNVRCIVLCVAFMCLLRLCIDLLYVNR